LQGTLSSDKDLVEAVRDGDDAAFEELYRRYERRIGAFVFGFVRDEGRAEDVTQEAFFSALRRIRQTDTDISFRPWIYEIARNAAIDLHRRTSRTEEVSISEHEALRPTDRRRLVGSAAPESALADKQRLEHLSGAFDELSESHHRILVLRELEGLSYREIGEQMELTAPAVESTLFRARRRLEHEYSEIDTGRRCDAMGPVIAKLAEGLGSSRDRSRLARHARRCNLCRRRARELGVEPIDRARSIAARAAALIPVPAFIQRRLGPQVPADAGAAGLAAQAAVVEGSGMLLAKAGALLAAAVVVGGGAQIGGIGPAAGERPLPAVAPAEERSDDASRSRGGASARGEGRVGEVVGRALQRAEPQPRQSAPAPRLQDAPGQAQPPVAPEATEVPAAPLGSQLPRLQPEQPQNGPQPPAQQGFELPQVPLEAPGSGGQGSGEGDLPPLGAVGASTAATIIGA
jgi:RNA polymerase sigma factor (sigma-70 family)